MALNPQKQENLLYFSKNLNKLLKTFNKKQIDLSRDLNIPASTISDYIKGKSLPNPGNLQKIADYFDVFKSDLDLRFKSDIDIFPKNHNKISNQTLSQITEISSQLDDIRQYKVLEYAKHELKKQTSIVNKTLLNYEFNLSGYASAGTGQQIFDEPIEIVQTSIKPPEHDIALKVIGDSMEPMFKDGEYIFVNKDTALIDGVFGVIIVNGESYVKKIYIEDNQLRLVSLNKEYEDIIVHDYDRYKFIGKVVL